VVVLGLDIDDSSIDHSGALAASAGRPV
jgi:hypothetical protein